MHVRWTKPAATALESIQDYIAKENPKAAHDVAQRIGVAAGQLEAHPEIGRTGRIRGTFELVIHSHPYIVLYRIKNKEVQILTVYHTSRKWPTVF